MAMWMSVRRDAKGTGPGSVPGVGGSGMTTAKGEVCLELNKYITWLPNCQDILTIESGGHVQ